MKLYLDKDNFGSIYRFLPKPQWYSVEVDVDTDLHAATVKLTTDLSLLNQYLDQLYESRRAGRPIPEIPPTVKEIIAQCLAPAAVAPAKKQKQQATAAASSSPSPKA